MDLPMDYTNILEMIPQPAFAVAEGAILCCNQLCRKYLPDTGIDIAPLLLTGKDEYTALTEGCLCLQLRLAGCTWDASATALDGVVIFRIEQPEVPAEVKAMALMGSQLRQSVGNLTILANRISMQTPDGDAFRHEISRIHRMLNNAANTERYLCNHSPSLELIDLCAVLRELTEEAAALLEKAGLYLEASLPAQAVIALADEQGLRQAVYNLLSNAAKFSPAGGTIGCKVTQAGDQLRISICDRGEGIPTDQRAGIFSRFARQATWEEGRRNLGLGLALVRAVANNHGGTVLLDSPEGIGTRVTMTLKLKTGDQTALQAPKAQLFVASANEGLIMLADVLPKEAYGFQL